MTITYLFDYKRYIECILKTPDYLNCDVKVTVFSLQYITIEVLTYWMRKFVQHLTFSI